jgi:hypothetical protein
VGRYLYSDNCNGDIRSLVPGLPAATGDRSEGLYVQNPTSFGQDSCGRLYITAGAGPVFRLLGSGTPDCGPALIPTKLALTVAHHRVRFGSRAALKARVSPCSGRGRQQVKLFRGHTRIATKRLNKSCVARFRPRIRHAARYLVKVSATATYAAASSARVSVAPRG